MRPLSRDALFWFWIAVLVTAALIVFVLAFAFMDNSERHNEPTTRLHHLQQDAVPT